MNFNAKLGKHVIRGDPNEMSKNGELLKEILDRHDSVVANATDKCKGLITRRRVTVLGIEESIIDYIILNKRLSEYLIEMIIDDKRENVLTNYSKTKVTESDHHILIGKFNILVRSRKYQEKKEVFNVRNPNNLKLFKDNTEDD